MTARGPQREASTGQLEAVKRILDTHYQDCAPVRGADGQGRRHHRRAATVQARQLGHQRQAVGLMEAVGLRMGTGHPSTAIWFSDRPKRSIISALANSGDAVNRIIPRSVSAREKET